MFPTLKHLTSLMAFVLLYIFASRVVRAVPAPDHIFDPLEARHEVYDDTPENLADFIKENGVDAQELNKEFKTRKATDLCKDDGTAGCIDSQFARCTGSRWVLTPCPSGTSCFALPLADEPGTVVTCKVPSEAEAMFEEAGMGGGPDGSQDGGDDCDDDGFPEDDDDCDDDGPPPVNINIVTTIVTTTTTTLYQVPPTSI